MGVVKGWLFTEEEDDVSVIILVNTSRSDLGIDLVVVGPLVELRSSFWIWLKLFVAEGIGLFTVFDFRSEDSLGYKVLIFISFPNLHTSWVLVTNFDTYEFAVRTQEHI